MRIIYFSNSYSTHDRKFLSALSTTRHEVFYLRLEPESLGGERRPVPERVRQVPWAGGRRRFRWRDVPGLVRDLRREIRAIQPDLIHAGPIQSCAFLAILSGFRPSLTMSWGFDLMQDAERNAWWRWVTRFTLRRSAFFISDAEVTRQRALAMGMDRKRTLVFPWGVDLNCFKPENPSSTGASVRRAASDEVVFLCNRSWEPRYGVDILAQAFVNAARQDPRIRLVLLGDGSQAGKIRQILSDGAVTPRILCPGRVVQDDLPDWYRTADIFVSPSHVDGSSVSLMEALACGVPALVSDIPANKEWIQDGVNGWLFVDGNPDQLAQRMLSLAANSRRLGQIRRAARETAELKADWSKNFPVLLEAYELTVQAN